MKMNLFALKDDVVQHFLVIVDEKKIKKIQSEINDWNGKGEVKEVTAVSIAEHFECGKKIEVISKEYSGKGEVFYSCCQEVEMMDMYNYKFYQYTPHPLSTLCDVILNDYESLDFSKHVAKLLNWNALNQEEVVFVNKLIDAFKFKRLYIDEVVKCDLTIEEKKSMLKRIKDAIKNEIKPRIIVITSKTYEMEVEKKIHDMEVVNSGFFGRELNGADFKYSQEEKNNIKRKILSSLPKVDLINKK